MRIESFQYKWTCLVGVAFLGSLLWSCAFQDAYSVLLVLLFAACFLVSVVVSVFFGITRRSKAAVYRILINVVFCLLLLPVILVGSSIRDHIFLAHLPRFQEAANILIEGAKKKPYGQVYSTVVPLPFGYSDLHVRDAALIEFTKESVTIRFLSRDSSALGHRGYMYYSDDDPAVLADEFPKTGFIQIAPHWFYFSE